MFGARAPDSRRSRAAVVQWARPFLDMPFPRQGGDVLWASDHIGALASIGLRSAGPSPLSHATPV